MRARLLLLCCLSMLAGCASGPNPRDPYERYNRKMYAFNESLDKALLKPVAKGYEWALPDFARSGVTNFFSNLDVVRTVLNQVAQGRIPHAIEDSARFTTNVVFGLGGLIDVASDMNFPRRREDFGQTLGYWGFRSGPYIVLPLLGSSNLRDALAFPVDFYTSPSVAWAENSTVTWSLIAINIVNQRAVLLPAEKFIEQTGLDRYAFLRDAYIQNREYQIRNGVPPSAPGQQRPKTLLELEEEEFGDEPVSPQEPARP